MTPAAPPGRTSEPGTGAAVAVFLGVGSNMEPARHVRAALERLRERFGPLLVSSVYRNRPAGFEGEDFLNLVVGFTTREPASAIVAELEYLHTEAGRVRDANRFASRTLDLDLLLYGDQVIEALQIPRPDITQYSFVLGPLAEVAPELRHPLTGQSMAELWNRFDQSRHPLQKLPLSSL